MAGPGESICPPGCEPWEHRNQLSVILWCLRVRLQEEQLPQREEPGVPGRPLGAHRDMV